MAKASGCGAGTLERKAWLRGRRYCISFPLLINCSFFSLQNNQIKVHLMKANLTQANLITVNLT
jgi:hypothetical protein